MAQLLVNFSAINNLKSNIKGAMDYLERRKDAINEIKRGVGNVGTSRNYLNSAINEMYRKNRAIDDKIGRLSGFRDELTTFAEFAEDTDQRVASRISSETESFCYSAGIGKAKSWFEQAFEDVCNWVSGAVDDVVDWYEKNKEAIWAGIELLADVLFLVLAVVAFIATLPASAFFAICVAIAAGFMLAKAAADVVSSTAAFICYCSGDSKNGAIWAERGLKDYMLMGGRGLDDLCGTSFWETSFSVLYTGMEIFSAVVSVANLGKTLYKSFKLKGLSWKDLFKGNKRTVDAFKNRFTDPKNLKNAFKDIIGIGKVPYGSSDKYKKLKESFSWLTKNTKTITNIAKFKAFAETTKVTYKTVKNIFDGKDSSGWFDNIKVVSPFNTVVDMFSP